MDFSYFTSAPQPYQFFGLQNPPSQSHTPQLDDYTTAPTADQYDAAFAAFQNSFHYDPTTFLAQPQHIPPRQSPTNIPRHDSLISIPEVDTNKISIPANDSTSEEQAPARSSSEEKEILTPAQSRRKAQNRAAQRAFRERKEKHVKDLEAQLTSLQTRSLTLNGENERLRRELAKVATENEILRATSGSSSNGPTPFLEEPDELVGPLGYVPTDRHSKDQTASSNGTSWAGDRASRSGPGPGSKYAQFGTLKPIAVDDESGEHILSSSATWDYIQEHELFRKGLVDVGDVCERLKKMARCDGQGPVFLEKDILQAIAESAVAGGRDELI